MAANDISIRQRLLDLQGNLLNFAFALTSDRDNAYDLLQDTTLKVLSNEDKYAENTNFRAWVFTIMKNIFINNYRRSVRSGIIIDTSDDLYQINVAHEPDNTNPDETYAVKEIMGAVNAFGPEYRVPFSLYLKGYKYAEIAQYMHLPVGTVKSRIFFARKRLKMRLQEFRE